jgi:hypothetical protein
MHRKGNGKDHEESSIAVKHLGEAEATRRFPHKNKQVQMIITKAQKQKSTDSQKRFSLLCAVFLSLDTLEFVLLLSYCT